MVRSLIFKRSGLIILILLYLFPNIALSFQNHPNDSLSTAYEITLDGTGHYFSDINGFTVSGASGDGIKYSNWLYTPEKNIWFKFVAPTSDTLSISIELSSSGQYGDLIQAVVTDSLGGEMGSKHWVNAANTTTPKELFIDNLQAGVTYYLNVDIPTYTNIFTLRFQNYIDSACIDTYTEYVGIDGQLNVEIDSLIDSSCSSWPCPTGNCTTTVFFPALGSSEFDIGKNYVTIQGIDDNDSIYYGTAIVNLVDTIPPTLVTKNIVRYNSGTHSNYVSPDDLIKYYSPGGTSVPAPNPVPGDGIEVFEYRSAYTKDNVKLGGASISKSSFNCTDVGTNEVTVTIWDTSGNETTGIALVYVIDDTEPVAKAKNITVYLDKDGIAQVNPMWVDNGSTAGCSGSDFVSSLNKSVFDKNDLGQNSITYIIEDSNSKMDTDIININVVDSISPVVFPLSKQIVLDESGNYTLTYDELMNPCENVTIPDPGDWGGGWGWEPDGSTPFFSPPAYSFDGVGCTYDNVEITDTSMSKTDFTTSDLGMNQVIITVIDQSGNTTEAIANINVVSAASCVTELWAIASGNWNDPSIWSATEGGAPLSVIPCNITNVYIKDHNVEINSHIGANKVFIINSDPELSSGLKVISGGLDVVEKIDIQGIGALLEGKPGARVRVLATQGY
ncbi:hypothetical protein EV198_2975 [Roseivirga ehrenbergii]|uniref:Uncharacterized protein n=1 Tax=Roseivirga ehrenbergii (strain DSM 102268 / JCM 13514 / KCTC 12282 / NCIMB 14502 / KMM 6017) TaxID=279360 RepID=A0A150XR17_ROSEK|nr:hypothetical protein [Roseivirga ehrenbergii]KYG81085.1 hypothetical protein MB14_15020 [Roseivirga ehrenbergii]TCL00958.1 hypothetical protein EV198_2975 [Roseivirga ehrenbergii]